MGIREIIELSVLAIIVLFILIYYIVCAIKNHWIKEIQGTIEGAIRKAEDLAKSGQLDKLMKKDYVLQQVEKRCEELGIPYHLLNKLISRIIDIICKNHNIFVK